MKITILGIGDAFSAKSYSSCFVIEHDNQRLLVDCPHPIRKILRESASLDISDIDAIVLTHLHADHASGLEGFAFFSRIVLGKNAKIITHNDIKNCLWDMHRSSMGQMLSPLPSIDKVREYQLKHLPRQHKSNAHMHTHEKSFFTCTTLPEYEEKIDRTIFNSEASVRHSVRGVLKFGKFELQCYRTIHHIPTFAWKISANGKTLAYSADTCFDRDLINWLADGSDLIIHESNLGPHTPYEMLLELPEEILCRIRLIHCPDDFIAEDLPMLKQGQTIEL